jgi:hypothetical protein
MLQCLILIDALSPACWEGEKNDKGAFFPAQDMPYWLCHAGLSQLLGAITG